MRPSLRVVGVMVVLVGTVVVIVVVVVVVVVELAPRTSSWPHENPAYSTTAAAIDSSGSGSSNFFHVVVALTKLTKLIIACVTAPIVWMHVVIVTAIV